MSRWQLTHLYFYSHHGKRVDLPFALNAVTIIVGGPYSGKSAVIESIDYVMGAKECHVPGIVRESCSWIGVHWVKDAKEILICREIPEPGVKSNANVHYDIGKTLKAPPAAEGLRRDNNPNDALKKFEAAIKLGSVKGETGTDREGYRVSFRSALPYMFVSDDVIIDKMSLLRGMNDERRNSILDSIAYFLGATDENAAGAEARVKRLKFALEKEKKAAKEAESVRSHVLDDAISLLEEAAQLNMIRGMLFAPEDEDRIRAELENIAGWAPSDVIDTTTNNRLSVLQSTERQVLANISGRHAQIAAAREVITSANGFEAAAKHQRERLDVASFFKGTGEVHSCPVCDGPIGERTPALDAIEEAVATLGAELAEVERDRPQIDEFIALLEQQVDEQMVELRGLRRQLAAVIRESEDNARRLDLEQRRLRVAGRVSYYLEVLQHAEELPTENQIETLTNQINALEAMINPEAKAERLRALELQISDYATRILGRLPFDVNYRDFHISFNAKKMHIEFVRGTDIKEMRDIGGDESYLSGRISLLFAIHRVFSNGKRPVPGTLIFDQISRPFYNAQTSEQRVDPSSPDSVDLKKYFDFLFDEVNEQKDIQVIALEHAFFAEDKRYMAAATTRWTDQKKLIPSDWPRKTLETVAEDAASQENVEED